MSAAERAKTHSPLISYPQKAAFGRVLPKNKIYEHSGANNRLKDLFVEQVEQIVWQYKLAPETINLPARASVPEVQIFSIQLKANDLHQDVLRCIDATVQFPILFELHRGQGERAQTQMVGTYKRRSEADASRWVLSRYFASDWLPAGTPRAPLPLALDMAALYEALLCRLIPLAHRSGESLADLIARVEQVEAKRREVEKAASRLAKEKQFNRKVQINATLRMLKYELEQLVDQERT